MQYLKMLRLEFSETAVRHLFFTVQSTWQLYNSFVSQCETGNFQWCNSFTGLLHNRIVASNKPEYWKYIVICQLRWAVKDHINDSVLFARE